MGSKRLHWHASCCTQPAPHDRAATRWYRVQAPPDCSGSMALMCTSACHLYATARSGLASHCIRVHASHCLAKGRGSGGDLRAVPGFLSSARMPEGTGQRAAPGHAAKQACAAHCVARGCSVCGGGVSRVHAPWLRMAQHACPYACCVLCRFYLPECWKVPVSIEGRDMQPWTLHAPRKHPSIASWQFVQVGGPACNRMGDTLQFSPMRLHCRAADTPAGEGCSRQLSWHGSETCSKTPADVPQAGLTP